MSEQFENGTHAGPALGLSPPFPAAGGEDAAFFPALDDSPLVPLAAVGDGITAGRDPSSGRFVPGNKLARGNPLARQAGRIRTEMYRACKRGDLKAVIEKLIAKARAGDVAAAKVLLERLLGPALSLDVIETVQRLENVVLKQRGPRP